MLAAALTHAHQGEGSTRVTTGKTCANAESAELMEKRGLTATPGNRFGLAAEAGLDPGEFMARVAGSMDARAGSLTALAEVLELETPEKEALAVAYTFERRS